MTKIYNSDLIKEIVTGVKPQIAGDVIPSETSDKVVLSLETNPRLLRLITHTSANSSSTSAANVTIVSADTTADIYIASINYHILKDSTCDSASGIATISVTLNGVSSTLTSVQTLTLTAQSEHVDLAYPIPIKIDRGTTVRFTMPTFSAGNCRVACSVQYYKVYNINA